LHIGNQVATEAETASIQTVVHVLCFVFYILELVIAYFINSAKCKINRKICSLKTTEEYSESEILQNAFFYPFYYYVVVASFSEIAHT